MPMEILMNMPAKTIVLIPWLILVSGHAAPAVAQALCAADGTPVEIKITAPVGAAGFGEKIALSADTLAVSAPKESVDGIGEAGAVYIYRHVAGAWSLEQRLPAPEPGFGDKFGQALDIEGDQLIVGDPFRADGPTKPTAGAVHFYQRTGTDWTRTQVFAGLADNDFLGRSVAIDVSVPKNSLSGDPLFTAVAGAPNHDFGLANDRNFGAAFVFELGPSGAWAPTLTLCRTPEEDEWCLADPSPVRGDSWGRGVALGGEFMLIGSINYDPPGGPGNAGGVRPMRRANSTGTFFAWGSEGIFTAQPPLQQEQIGAILAMSRNGVLLVGRTPGIGSSTPGRVPVFKATIPGIRFQQVLDRGAGQDSLIRFGTSVAVTHFGSLLAIGSDNATEPAQGGGLIDLFLRSQNSWVNVATLRASDRFTGDLLGAGVAVSRRFVAAGAPGAGAVYVFGQCEFVFDSNFE